MALSNIFREPRREITETVVGFMVFLGFAYIDMHFAFWFQGVTGGFNNGCPWPIGFIFVGPVIMIVLILLALLIHAIGEWICNSLARRGLELRPKQRY